MLDFTLMEADMHRRFGKWYGCVFYAMLRPAGSGQDGSRPNSTGVTA